MATIDDIGAWSEIKLAIVRDYATEYSKVLNATEFYPGKKATYVYIDAFAGSGVHVSRTSGQLVLGSPLNALEIIPRFHEYHFIDMDKDKADTLETLTEGDDNVWIYRGDANDILRTLLPKIRRKDYKRALCLLDPYGLHYDWEIIKLAGELQTIEIFLNFSIMDANLNVLLKNPDQIDAEQARRLTTAWGDGSWRQIAYTSEGSLFGYESKVTNEDVAQAFRERLRSVAGFPHVPEPLPIRNSNGAVLYYLYFAAHRPVAAKIVQYIFDKYRRMGVA